jgi:hypothetical protein
MWEYRSTKYGLEVNAKGICRDRVFLGKVNDLYFLYSYEDNDTSTDDICISGRDGSLLWTKMHYMYNRNSYNVRNYFFKEKSSWKSFLESWASKYTGSY